MANQAVYKETKLSLPKPSLLSGGRKSFIPKLQCPQQEAVTATLKTCLDINEHMMYNMYIHCVYVYIYRYIYGSKLHVIYTCLYIYIHCMYCNLLYCRRVLNTVPSLLAIINYHLPCQAMHFTAYCAQGLESRNL